MCKETKIISSLINNNVTDFWKKITRSKSNDVYLPDQIDRVKGDKDINNLFTKKYNALFNSVSYDNSDMGRVKELITQEAESHSNDGNCNKCQMVNTQQVIKAVEKLKRHKHDGNTEVYTYHFKSAPNVLYELIADLSTSMFKHGHSPKQFSISTIISIPKNKQKSFTASTNYREMALSSIPGKIFDWIILNTNGEQFKTTDMQFGFKADHSTSQCTCICL